MNIDFQDHEWYTINKVN